MISEKQLTQTELARRLNKPPQYIHRLLERESIQSRILEEIMEVTGITPDELFCHGDV